MKKTGHRDPKDGLKHTVRSKDRERRNIKRKDCNYISGRYGQHIPTKNYKFKLKGKVRGTEFVRLPATMDLSSDENRNDVLSAIARIKSASLYGNYRKVVLDHTSVTSMSPEVAMLMLAEIQRCRIYCEPRTQLTGTYPANHDVSHLLTEIGFYKSLGIKAPKLPATYDSRTYIRVERHNKILAKVADDLLTCFETEFTFSPEDKRRLQIALVECMDNVFQHAYVFNESCPAEAHLFREWWMVGYSDSTDKSISFSFLDQGRGIASTIRRKLGRSVIGKLGAWHDGHFISRAVRKRISRIDSKRRGHGLKKLKAFVDRLEFNGTLRVLANNGDVQWTTGQKSVERSMPTELSGTLVVWSLKPPQLLPTTTISHADSDHEIHHV
ncbi:hypothetical protein ABFO19_16610 [Xanthomonas citri pv. glycines]|uniref:hypothetical protein n=1 Tax=Xanthomonas TaxID=338 RepID=UPI000A6317DE|nr:MULTISPECIES: hypothetical protein [Xanthomonas]QTK38067.1 hypothetical protein XcgCFBP7119R_17295 [Xanthomonas citri pv. glycines]